MKIFQQISCQLQTCLSLCLSFFCIPRQTAHLGKRITAFALWQLVGALWSAKDHVNVTFGKNYQKKKNYRICSLEKLPPKGPFHVSVFSSVICTHIPGEPTQEFYFKQTFKNFILKKRQVMSSKYKWDYFGMLYYVVAWNWKVFDPLNCTYGCKLDLLVVYRS